MLIGNWREDKYGQDLVANRAAAPAVFKNTYETTFRSAYVAPGRDAIASAQLTPLQVMTAQLTPVSLESFAAPVSLSSPVRAERPSAHVIEACANASAELSENTRVGVRKDMIFDHTGNPDPKVRYHSTYAHTICERHKPHVPPPPAHELKAPRTDLHATKQHQWAADQKQIVRESLAHAQTVSSSVFNEQKHTQYCKSLTDADTQFRSRSVITNEFKGSEFKTAGLLR